MTNKELVLAFYDEVFNGWDTSHLDRYVREDYIQHNPDVEDGLAGFTKFIEFFTSMRPHVDIIRCDEVGDMVYVFFKCTMGNGMINKVVDMYRIQDGKLAEHWDVVEHDVAAKMAAGKNSHGIF